MDHSQVQQRPARAQRRRALGPRPARDRPRRAARRCGAAQPDVRTGSRDAHALHSGRDDRQQLVRRALGHGRQDGRQRPRARRSDLSRRPFHASAQRRRRVDRITSGSGAQAEIYRGMAALRDTFADEIRRASRTSRVASPATTCRGSWRSKGFNVARALVGSESTLVTVLEAKVRLVDEPARANARRRRVSRRLRSSRRRPARSCSRAASPARAWTKSSCAMSAAGASIPMP